MDKFKGILPIERPDIIIEPKNDVSFDIRINEVAWMYCDTRLGNGVTWGIYDQPDWKMTDCSVTETYRKASIHGIDCVEVRIMDYASPLDYKHKHEYSLYIHADEEQIQYVARSEIKDGVFTMMTLYDDSFIRNYSVDMPGKVTDSGFGIYSDVEMNDISAETANDSFLMGGGVYDVTIGSRTFECLRVFNRWQNSPRILVENYMNRDGRSVLFRRYNSPVWKLERYGQRWDKKFPDAGRLTINGEEYIHWYDCLSDLVFK